MLNTEAHCYIDIQVDTPALSRKTCQHDKFELHVKR